MEPESDEIQERSKPLSDYEMRRAIDKRFNEVAIPALLYACRIDCLICRMLFTTLLLILHLPHSHAVIGTMSFLALTEFGQIIIQNTRY